MHPNPYAPGPSPDRPSPEGYPGYPASYAEPGYGNGSVTPGDRGSQLRDWLDILLRGKWIILGATLLIAVPIILYTYSLPAYYETEALVMLNTGGAMGDLSQVLPMGGGMSRQSRMIENELLVLRSSLPLAERAAARLLEYQRDSNLPLTILGEGEEAVPTVGAVARRLQGRYVSSNAARDVDAIRISAGSTIPDEAALIANVYAEAYVERTQEASRSRMAATRSFLEEQVERREGELTAAEDRIESFMATTGAIALDQESSNVVSQLGSLEAMRDEINIELQMRRSTLDAVESALNQIEPRLVDRLASGVNQASLQRLNDEIAQVQQNLEEVYMNNPAMRNPDAAPQEIREAQRRLAELQDRRRQVADQFVSEVSAAGGIDPAVSEGGQGFSRVAELQRQAVAERIAISGLESRLGVIGGRIGENERRIQTLPAQSMQLARLSRDRIAVEKLYVLLVERLQEIRVAEESELGYAEILRPAFTPSTPVSPNRPRNVMLGIFLGLGLGLVLAVARTRLDHRIYIPEDLRVRGHVTLGVIPSMEQLIKKEFGGSEMVEVDGQRLSTRLVTLLDPLASVSEAYRALRTNVQFSRPDSPIQTLIITSSSPSEGKTTTAANLAITMAQAGRRVLLIDADLRRPSMHKLFGIPRDNGLKELLFSPVNRGAEVQTSTVENLDLLTAGSTAPNPSELLGSKRMRDLLASLREEYDLIVVDAPPVLAATDAVLLSTEVDATLFVVEAGSTQDHQMEHAVEQLNGVGARLIGVVLNRFDAMQTYGYKYKYKYAYQYKC